MKYWLLYTIVGVLLTVLLFAGIYAYFAGQTNSEQPNIFLGIDAAYDDVESLKRRVDEAKSYTNFFIIGSTGITFYEIKLNDLCQYIYERDMYFAIFAHTNRDATIPFNHTEWSFYARERWGERFWGLYAYDEPGGHQIDQDEWAPINSADNYSDATNRYVEKVGNDALLDFLPLDVPLMTSDYALYEFDYRSGYDVVLTELAWNHSRPINIALARGAATVHDKEWGVMLTYTYTTSPYLASGKQVFEDLVLAYQNGAKYFFVFDYAKDPKSGLTHGILQPEHFDALRRFWTYAQHNPRPQIGERVTYVLPRDYAYGFRGPRDSIWGLWGPDEFSSKIWTDVNGLVVQYDAVFDIIYEDVLLGHNLPYQKAVLWNGTVLMH